MEKKENPAKLPQKYCKTKNNAKFTMKYDWNQKLKQVKVSKNLDCIRENLEYNKN